MPLAVLLDRIGRFEALAQRVDGGERLIVSLWVLAALVTIVFNLEAAVVLLTPLYIRVAQRHRLPPESLAFQPALMACLASNPLPVSNLTNLIVSERFHLGVWQFLLHLSVPTVLACWVGWFGYRRLSGRDLAPNQTNSSQRSADGAGFSPTEATTALRRGLPIVGFVLLGFTLGSAAGVPAWVVAAVAVAWASALTRRVAWRVIPYEAMFVAAGLSVLVAAAVPHLRLDHLFGAAGLAGRAWSGEIRRSASASRCPLAGIQKSA